MIKTKKQDIFIILLKSHSIIDAITSGDDIVIKLT
jgi:hypothetical protein